MANGFQSVGGRAVDAFTQALLQRAMQERQQQMDALAREESIAQRELAAQASKRADEGAKSAAKQQRYGQAKDIVEMAGANEQITPETKAMLEEAGFGGRVESRFTPGTPGIGVLAVDELPADAKVGESAEMLKPGFRFEQARAAEGARADLEKEKAAERAKIEAERAVERTDRDQLNRELRATIAGGQQGIAREGLQLRQDIQAGKDADKATAMKAKRASALGIADSMKSAINDLVSIDEQGAATLKPGTAKMVGGSRISPGLPEFMGGSGLLPGVLSEKVPGSTTADSRAALQQLVGQRVVELMREMKSQSSTGATGFGALSEKELALLQAASARLQTAQSDEAFTKAIMEVNTLVDKIYQEAGQGEGGSQATSEAAGAGTSKYKRIGGTSGGSDSPFRVSVQ